MTTSSSVGIARLIAKYFKLYFYTLEKKQKEKQVDKKCEEQK